MNNLQKKIYKFMYGRYGFDELYKPVFDLTESLRAKQFNDELFEQVEKQYKVILDAYNQLTKKSNKRR